MIKIRAGINKTETKQNRKQKINNTRMKPGAGSLKKSIKFINFQPDSSRQKERGHK